MKKIISILLIAILSILIVGCSQQTVEQEYKPIKRTMNIKYYDMDKKEILDITDIEYIAEFDQYNTLTQEKIDKNIENININNKTIGFYFVSTNNNVIVISTIQKD